jgi:hypothetical protein
LFAERPQIDAIAASVFQNAMRAAEPALSSLDSSLFETAMNTFFADPDPEYAEIKWHMAQSRHVLRLIGLDEKAQNVAAQLFSHASFYLDTNLIVAALAPHHVHHSGFVALSKACSQLDSKLKVCSTTLDELDRVVQSARETLEKVLDQIPPKTAAKVRSDFYEIYCENVTGDRQSDLDRAFGHFRQARQALANRFGVEVDETSLAELEGTTRTATFAQAIADRYRKLRIRSKKHQAAVHDALCLQRVEECRTSHSSNIWFVTRDYTLPGCTPPQCSWRSLAMTLDALLQWLSPIYLDQKDEGDVALAFSHIVGLRVLPQERVFNLRDFQLFHELDMQCKSLPSEDVEGCIRRIKTEAPFLDPTAPEHREQLANIVGTYFADPSRRYKQNLARYESQVSDLQTKLREVTTTVEAKDARLKASLVLVALIVCVVLAVALVLAFSPGENDVQVLAKSWPLLSGVASVVILSGAFWLGKRRIVALGWPFTRLFGVRE